jgi:hypothetical protein
MFLYFVMDFKNSIISLTYSVFRHICCVISIPVTPKMVKVSNKVGKVGENG